MADLNPKEIRTLEKLFQMGGGYVLDFTNTSFQELVFNTIKIDIYNGKGYEEKVSKGKKLRAIWRIEINETVGKLTSELINYYEDVYKEKPDFDPITLSEAKKITRRLLGEQKVELNPEQDKEDFIKNEITLIDIGKLNLDSEIEGIIKSRFLEMNLCIANNIPLASVILIGSILEGVLLNTAKKNPYLFNSANSAPKSKENQVKQFNEWTLDALINVAREKELIGLDVMKFSHALRDFRNYVHPHHQLKANFSPDMETVAICFQVLKAALRDLSNKIPNVSPFYPQN